MKPLLLLLSLLAVGCSESIPDHIDYGGGPEKYVETRPMPAGYTLMCDDEGRYTFKTPDGIVLSSASKTRDEAIRRAWWHTEPFIPPIERNWKECE